MANPVSPQKAFTLTETKELVISSLQLEGMNADSIGDDDPLFGEGLGLDSVDALELVVAMEKQFKIKIHSNEIEPEAFASAASLCRFINRQLACDTPGDTDSRLRESSPNRPAAREKPA